MPSLMTHPSVPLALAAALGPTIPRPLLVAGVGLALLPDIDGITLWLGIARDSPLSHRGLTHSLAAAVICAAAATSCARYLRTSGGIAFAFLFVSMASHGVLDAFTNRGYGVALFWPLSDARVFFDFRPIETSPISVERFLTRRGLEVIRTELLWVWLPLTLFALAGYAMRRGLSGSVR